MLTPPQTHKEEARKTRGMFNDPLLCCQGVNLLTPTLPSTHSPREGSVEFHVFKSVIAALVWLPLAQFLGLLKKTLFNLAKSGL